VRDDTFLRGVNYFCLCAADLVVAAQFESTLLLALLLIVALAP